MTFQSPPKVINTRKIIDILKKQFANKDFGEAKYCLGIEIIKKGKNIFLLQAGYIKGLLIKFGMTHCKEASTSLTHGFKPIAIDQSSDESLPYQELVGSLMYVALAIRLNIAHSVNVLSQFNRQHDRKI